MYLPFRCQIVMGGLQTCAVWADKLDYWKDAVGDVVVAEVQRGDERVGNFYGRILLPADIPAGAGAVIVIHGLGCP